jgi:hypothetical protein
VQEDQSVSQMAQEVLTRQAKVLTQRSGYSLEEARQAVSDTQAGRQLRELASGEQRHEKAQTWQASVFWKRAEERFMHLVGSEALSRALQPNATLDAARASHAEGLGSRSERARTLVE